MFDDSSINKAFSTQVTKKDPFTDVSENVQHGEQYNPYQNNQGTVLAIAGKDFVVISGDTRLSSGYTILSRDSSKLCQLTDKVFLASSGMYADMCALQKNLKARIEIYRSQHKRDPDVASIASMLSVTLYMRRFFPFYAFNLLCGQKHDGNFAVYGYDAIGSYDEMSYGSQGSGVQLIAPVLDNVVKRAKLNNTQVTKQEAIKLIEEVMTGVSNRDIYTGDKCEHIILTADGKIERLEFILRKD